MAARHGFGQQERQHDEYTDEQQRDNPAEMFIGPDIAPGNKIAAHHLDKMDSDRLGSIRQAVGHEKS